MKKRKVRESTHASAVPTKFNAYISGLLGPRRKCGNIGISAIHLRRASALRRRQCGAKIGTNFYAD